MILQIEVPVLSGDDAESLRLRVQTVEVNCYLGAIKKIF